MNADGRLARAMYCKAVVEGDDAVKGALEALFGGQLGDSVAKTWSLGQALEKGKDGPDARLLLGNASMVSPETAAFMELKVIVDALRGGDTCDETWHPVFEFHHDGVDDGSLPGIALDAYKTGYSRMTLAGASRKTFPKALALPDEWRARYCGKAFMRHWAKYLFGLR